MGGRADVSVISRFLSLICSQRIHPSSAVKRGCRTVPYHHGDLRAELIRIGLDLARAAGGSGISVREAARRAEVTPNAVYRHFADLATYVAGVRGAVLSEVAARMAPPWDQPPSPRQQLRDVGTAYIAFALDEPGWFGLAFGDIQPDPATPAAPFVRLSSALDALAESEGWPKQARSGAEWPCWAAVHGFALLSTRGPLRTTPRDQLDTLASQTVDAIIDGLRARASAHSPSAQP
jgi:AcrR family transcriptional regulator